MYRLELEGDKLNALLKVAHLPRDPGAVAGMFGPLVLQAGKTVQARVIYNLGGFPVQYDGKVFRVRVVTGALRGSIELQWPYQTALSARVFVNGAHTADQGRLDKLPGGLSKPRPVSEYARAVEEGHGEIDLKKTMMGKTVPFYAARSKATGGSPYATRPVIPVMEGHARLGDWFHNPDFDRKLAARGKQPMFFQKRGAKTAPEGKGGGAYYISFRKVGKTGWVIPAKEGRPYMKAAFSQVRTQVRRQMVAGATEIIRQELHL